MIPITRLIDSKSFISYVETVLFEFFGTPGSKLFRPDYPTVMINLLGNILTESQALQLRNPTSLPNIFLIQFRRIGKSIPEKVHHVALPLPSDNFVPLTLTQTIALASDARNSVSSG